MSNKSEFHGDVGQAVVGDLNEAPRLSNVVNLNMGEHPERPLTKLQRRLISAKVDEVAKAADIHRLDVYGMLLTDFGAEKMEVFPREQYKAAMAKLDELLEEALAEASDEPPATQPLPAPAPLTVTAATTCSHCAEQMRQAKHARVMMAVQTVAMLGIAGVFSWMLWIKPSMAASQMPPQKCHVDGKAYSIGSSVRMPTGVMRECVLGQEGAIPYWGKPVANARR